ncbi:MAG: cytidine deaminase [Halioglobus sp.]|jgi:cytidine deaminase
MAIDLETLAAAARAVRENAYARYSGFRVGAAVLDENGALHVGVNVENAAYPLGSCAEANAIGAMISAGGKHIVRIVVFGGRQEIEACTPCGGCRQRIAEFADKDTDLVMLGEGGALSHFTIDEMLPASFSWPETR